MTLDSDSTPKIGESIMKEIVLSLCTGIHCELHTSKFAELNYQSLKLQLEWYRKAFATSVLALF